MTAVHKAVHYHCMGKHVNSRSRAIRLSNDQWSAIETAAGELGMSVNEFVARRLAASSRVSQNRKTVEIDRDSVTDDELVRVG